MGEEKHSWPPGRCGTNGFLQCPPAQAGSVPSISHLCGRLTPFANPYTQQYLLLQATCSRDAPWEDDLGEESPSPARRDSWAWFGGHLTSPSHTLQLTHFRRLQMPQTKVLSLQRRFVSMRKRRKRKEKPWMVKEVRYRPIPGVSQEK